MATMIQAAWMYVWPNCTTKFFLDLYAERGCGILVSCLTGSFMTAMRHMVWLRVFPHEVCRAEGGF